VAQQTKYLERGKKFLAQKDYSRAIIEFRNATRPIPKDAEPWYQLGMAALQAKQFQQAVAAFRQAVKLNPNHAGAQLRLAELLVTSHDPQILQEAVQKLDQVLAGDPNQADALDALALADLKLKKPEESVKLLQQALEKFPGHLRSSAALAALQFSQHDAESAEQTLKKAVAAAPKSPEAALALAQLYFLEQKKFDAERELQRALSIDAGNVYALLSLGALQMSDGRTDKAEESYKKLAALPNSGWSHIHAVFLFEQGRKDEAIREFEKLAADHPKDQAAQIRLAGAYLSSGRRQDAMNHLAALLKKNPKDTDALLLRSRIYLDNREQAQAQRDLESVIHFRPDSADAHYGLSRVFAMQHRERSRWQELGEVLRLNPRLLSARVELAKSQVAAGQPKAAMDTMAAAPPAQKSSAAWVAANNWALMALNRLTEVGTGLDQALRTQRDPELVLQSGILKAMQQDYAGARAAANELIRLNPANMGAANLAIRSYVAQNDREGALRLLNELAVKDATSPGMQLFIGQSFQALGKTAEARQAYSQAKSLNTKWVEPDLNLAGLDQQEGKMEVARGALNAIIAKYPQNETAHLMLANLEYSAKNPVLALTHYRAVADLNPDNVQALNAAAYLLASQDPETAIKWGEHALELAPGNPVVQDTLGWVYYQKGLYPRAVELLSMSVSKQPTAVHQYHLGMSYLKTGDAKRAETNLSQAMAKDPNVAKVANGQ
jgi:tetratricopeptide (TPR) repeat protein